MSTNIDNRVLEMKFDNASFEKNVSTSMDTLSKLNKSLSLTEGTRGLSHISDVAKRIDLSGMSNGIEAVKMKFSALEVMAITTVANITNSAVNAGKRIAMAFTIDPIKTGFQEYETQINAVQTILANTESKGTTLNNVNAALAELNAYADKTIYNFTEMTRNIGTFTAAGVDLNTSVSAIKGIANLAAVSGSNAQQASTAMYQLSQALASGTVKLMDWNSVVNAGMGGQVFQDALKETARLHGVSIDSMIKKEGSFRETLSEGWLSSEILTETLSKFTGDLNAEQLKSMGYNDDQIKSILKLGQTANDAATKVKTFTQLFDTLKEAAQSGWTQSWATIVGDFGEAKELLTEMSNTFGGIIGGMADKRNDTLMGGLGSGWKQILYQGVADSAGYEEEIAKVALKHGIDLNKMVDDQTSFQDALKKTMKEGKIGTSTFTEALQSLTDKTAGLSDAQLKEIGYTREQVTKLEEFNKSVKDGSINMGDFTAKMMVKSGRENLIEALRNSLNGLLEVIKPISEGFREIFPAMTAEQLYAFTEKMKELTSHFHLTAQTTKDLKNTFKGLFAVVDIVGRLLKAVLSPLVGQLDSVSGGVLGVTGSIGEWLVNLDDLVKKTDIFNVVVKGFIDGIKNFIGDVKNGFANVKESVGATATELYKFGQVITGKLDFSPMEVFYDLMGRLRDRIASVVDSLKGFKSGVLGVFNAIVSSDAFNSFVEGAGKLLEGIGKLFAKIGNSLKPIVNSIGEILKQLGSSIYDALSSGDFNKLFDVINGGLIGGLLLTIRKYLKGFTKVMDGIGDTITGAASFKTTIIDGFNAIKGAVLNTFTAFQEKLKADILLKIAGAIAILTLSLVVLSLMDSTKLSISLGIITGLFVDLMGSMAVFGKIAGTDLKGMSTLVAGMIGMSIALAILAGVLLKLSSLSWQELVVGLGGLTGMVIILLAMTSKLSKMKVDMLEGVVQLLALTLVLKVLVSVVKDIAQMSFTELAKGLIGLGGILLALSLFMKNTKFDSMGVASAIGLIAFAVGINLLAKAVGTLGELNTGALIQGLIALQVILKQLTFIQDSTSATDMVSTAIGMAILGGALIILSKAVQAFGAIPIGEIVKGIAAMGGVMIVLTTAMNRMPKNMIAIGVGLVVVGTALNLISMALSAMGGMSWEEIGKGLLVLSVALIAISIAVNAMTGALAGAAAMLVVAAALNLMVPMLLILSAMTWSGIVVGMAALAGAFLVMGAAGLLLAPLVPVIIALAASFVLIGAGIALVGVGLLATGTGLTALAAGFAALATLGSAGAIAVVKALGIIVVGMATLIPMVMAKIAEGIGEFAKVIIANAPLITTAVITVITSIMTALIATVPMVVEGIYVLLTSVLTTLTTYAPTIIDAVLTLLIQILEGITAKLPDIMQAGVELIMAFIQGIADSSVQLADAAFNAMITFINGMSDSIDKNTPTLVNAMNRLMDSLISAALFVLTNSITRFKERGKAMIEGIKNGISDKVEDVKSSVRDIITGAVTAVEEKIEAFKSAGGNIVSGLINGIKDKFEDARKAASDLGSKILESAKNALGIKSPSREFAEVGRWSVMGLSKGLQQYASNVYGVAADVATGTVDAMKSSFNGISNIIDGNFDLNPVIAPTLDLSNITNGAKTINSMFNKQQLGMNGETVQNDGTGAVNGGINYTQIINSPKAVSRTEIYRQTKNMFATSKGMVNNT